jgi:prepilin-type N-terminal cleavage/methylation domain-containing protein/prepilin-type processing-associated H-X9-DG protein
MNPTRRRAFTLVELLVSIAIIGTLIALLLPAVQAAREAARDSQCRSNLHQIAIAMQQHDNSYRMLPPAGKFGAKGLSASAFFQILPFMEEDTLFKAYDHSVSADDAKNKDVVSSTIPVFLCPSMVLPDNEPVGGRSSYGVSTGSGYCRYPVNPIDGKPDLSNHNGVIIDRIRGKVRVADVSRQDGSSKTIVVGDLDYGLVNAAEKSAGVINGGSTRWATAYPGVTWASMAGVFNSDRLVTGFLEWETFRSEHPGGVNFAMVDGSVRRVNDDTHPDVLKRLAERNDGQSLDSI